MTRLPASSLEECYAFEDNLETGFVALHKAAGIPNIGSSRSGAIFETPFVSIWWQNGQTLNHQHAFPDGRIVWDTFDGILSTEIVTHRGDDSARNEHGLYIAKFRKQMQLFRLVPLWPKFQNIDLVIDIREGGTVDTWEDENNLDHSTITWNIRHNINPLAWPINIDS